MSAPLVSILVPAFNAELWIADTLRSALAQTWPRTEIIVVDDGSRDQTLAIARQFAGPHVAILTQANQGAAAARNHAFSRCQGTYVQWLDADDLLAPDKIGRQMETLADIDPARTLLSSAWAHFIHRPHKARFAPTRLWCDLSPLEWLLRKLRENLYMQTATWLVSRELTEAAGPWNTQLCSDDDGEYFCRVLLQSAGTRFVPDAKVFYRATGADRLSYVGRSWAKMDALLLSMELHIRYIRSLEDSARVRNACLTYLQRSLLTFYPDRPDLLSRVTRLAADLGGQLDPPRLSWKYAWIARTLGWSLAKRAHLFFPRCKEAAVRVWDKVLCTVDEPRFFRRDRSTDISASPTTT